MSEAVEMRVCTKCNLSLPLISSYHRHPLAKRGRQTQCKACHSAAGKAYRARRRLEDPKGAWWQKAVTNSRSRSKKAGYTDHTLQVDSPIFLPDFCPILGITLLYANAGKNNPASASLDQLVPGAGYWEGNVFVISSRANTLKRDGSAEELFKVAAWVAERNKQRIIRG